MTSALSFILVHLWFPSTQQINEIEVQMNDLCCFEVQMNESMLFTGYIFLVFTNVCPNNGIDHPYVLCDFLNTM